MRCAVYNGSARFINLIFVKLFGSLSLTLQANIVGVRSEPLIGLNKVDQEGASEA